MRKRLGEWKTQSSLLGNKPEEQLRFGHRSCPLNWEKTPDEAKDALGVDSFDVIVAADCCYMPWLHDELLSTIGSCLSRDGVALIPFCLVGNRSVSSCLAVF